MRVDIPAYKHIGVAQHIDFNRSNICALIGGNGSGKSTILESIFYNYIDKENFQREQEGSLRDTHRCIAFSSGQNELFSEIFNDYEKNINRFRSEGDEIIRSFYFDYWWSKLLIFFATSLKHDGLVRKYLLEQNYIDVADNKDNSTFININLRVRKPLVDRVFNEHLREEGGDFVENSLIRSLYLEYLEKVIQAKINHSYSFREKESIHKVVSRNISIKANEAIIIFNDNMNVIFNDNINKIFTFFARATGTWLSNLELEEIGLFFKNNLELRQLSDGEYQLLSIYALIDLFDGENTIFLLDEVDSHLHHENIGNLWQALMSVEGKIISTTHISESILFNDFSSISYVENGLITNNDLARELINKVSGIIKYEPFRYQLIAKLKNIVLIDDELDWEIFKRLAKIKIGISVDDFLNNIVPIKETSGYNFESQLFADKKINLVKKIKEFSDTDHCSLLNVFMICDLDEYPISSINSNSIECKITDKLRPEMNQIRSFNNNRSKSYLLSWRRREILHYLLSFSMLKHFNKLADLQNIAGYIDNDRYIGNNFDSDSNIINASKVSVKFIKELMYVIEYDGSIVSVNYNKIDEVINKIPPEEISDDIVLMYNFLKDKVERSN